MAKTTPVQPQPEVITTAEIRTKLSSPEQWSEEELWREMLKLSQAHRASKQAAATTQAVHGVVIPTAGRGKLVAPATPTVPTTMSGNTLPSQDQPAQSQKQEYCRTCHNRGEINRMMPVGEGDAGGINVQYSCPECELGQKLLKQAQKEIAGVCQFCNRGWKLTLVEKEDQYHLTQYSCQPCLECETGLALSREIETKRAAFRAKRLAYRLQDMPEELRHKSFANFSQEEVEFDAGRNNDGTPRLAHSNRLEALTFVKERVLGQDQQEHRNLLLMGRPGTGKSHLAAAAFFAKWQAGEDGVFLTFNRLGDKLKATYSNPDGPRYDDLLEYYQRLPVLVLDDLGTQKPSEADIKIATELINYRFSNPKLWTMLTTNLSGPQLAEWFGERFKSRLGKQHFDRFVLVAPDWRAQEW